MIRRTPWFRCFTQRPSQKASQRTRVRSGATSVRRLSNAALYAPLTTEVMEQRVMLDARMNLAEVAQVLPTVFDAVQDDSADQTALATELPFIGELSTSAFDVLADIADRIERDRGGYSTGTASALAADLEDSIEAAFANGANATVSVIENSESEVRFRVQLAGGRSQNVRLQSDLGFAGLGFELANPPSASVRVSYDLDFEIGVRDANAGTMDPPDVSTFVDVAGANDLEVGVAVNLAGKKLSGDFGVLTATGTVSTAEIATTFSVDVQTVGPGNEVELGGSLSDLTSKLDADFTVTGTANATIDLEANLAPGAGDIGLLATVQLTGSYTGDDTSLGDEYDLGVRFENVELDTGKLIQGIVSPILQQIAPVVEPLRGLLDTLNRKVVDDFGITLTYYDILQQLFDVPNIGALEAAGVFLDMLDAASSIQTNQTIRLGSFTFDGLQQGGTEEASIASASDSVSNAERAKFRSVASGLFDSIDDLEQIGSRVEVLDNIEQSLRDRFGTGGAATDGRFDFTFLDDPSVLFGLFTGDTSGTLIEFALPEFRFTRFESIEQFVSIGPVPVKLFLEGGVAASIGMAGGYSLQGVADFIKSKKTKGGANPGTLRNGLYFDTDETRIQVSGYNPNSGAITDTFIRLGASVGFNFADQIRSKAGEVFELLEKYGVPIKVDGAARTAIVSAVLAVLPRAEIVGSLSLVGSITAEFDDPTPGDGRMTFADIRKQASLGAECLIKISGKLEAVGQVKLIVEVTIDVKQVFTAIEEGFGLNTGIAAIDNTAAGGKNFVNDPGGSLADVRESGQEYLKDREAAAREGAGKVADGVKQVVKLIPKSIKIDRDIFAPYRRELVDFSIACRDAGQKNAGRQGSKDTADATFKPRLGRVVDGNLTLFVGDLAKFRNVQTNKEDEKYFVRRIGSDASGETVLITAFGFEQLETGVRSISARGGDGDDEIILDSSISSFARLSGDSGNDTLQAGGGGSLIDGGSGNDTLTGGAGIDEIYGDSIISRATIREGNDTIVGGLGNDRLDGQGGNDTIYGDLQDSLDLRGGDDQLFGGAGRDKLIGGAGLDRFDPGTGTGELDGGEGNDVFFLTGATGSQQIAGGAGTDAFRMTADSDLLLSDTVLQAGSVRHRIEAMEGAALIGGDRGRRITINEFTGVVFADGQGGYDRYDVTLAGAGVAQVIINDSADSGALSVRGTNTNDRIGKAVGEIVLSNSGVANPDDLTAEDFDRLDYAGVNDLTIDGRGSDDEIVIFDSEAGVAHTVLGGGGSDQIMLRGFDGTLDAFRSEVDIDAGTGVANQVLLFDDLSSGNSNIVVTDSSVTGLAPVAINYAATGGRLFGNAGTGLGVFGSLTGRNVFSVHSTLAGSQTRIQGGDGDDVVRVGSDEARADVADVRGVLWSAMAGGANQLLVDDTGRTTATSFTVTDTVIDGLAPGGLVFTAAGGSYNTPDGRGVVIRGSDGARDVANIESLLAGNSLYFNGQRGNDLTNVTGRLGSDDGNLDAIQGRLRINGGGGSDRIHANDAAASGKTGYDLRPDALRVVDDPADELCLDEDVEPRPLFAGIKFDDSMERVMLVGNDERNLFRVRPSRTTIFGIDGNLPAAGEFGVAGDFLKLELDAQPPIDRSKVSGQKIRFTEVVGGRQQAGRWTFTSGHQQVQFREIEGFNLIDQIATAEDAGRNENGRVSLINATTQDVDRSIRAFTGTASEPYRGGVRSVMADLNSDGVAELIAVSGVGQPAILKVFNGVTGGLMAQRQVGPTENRFGANVAAGDIDGDGRAEILTSLERTAGPKTVSVWQMNDAGTGIRSEGSFDSGFSSDTFVGTQLAAGDLNGDGVAEVIVTNAAGTTNRVRIFDRAAGTVRDLDAFAGENRGGIRATIGDIDGDRTNDLILAEGRIGKSKIVALSGEQAARGRLKQIGDRLTVFESDSSIRAALDLVAKDVDGDCEAELIVGQQTDGREGRLAFFDLDDDDSLAMLDDLTLVGTLDRGIQIG